MEKECRGGCSKDSARTLQSACYVPQQRGQPGHGPEKSSVRGCGNVAETAVWPCGGDANGRIGRSGERRGRRQGGGFAMAPGSSGLLVGEVVRDDVHLRSGKIRTEVDEARRADCDSDPHLCGARHRKAVDGLKFMSTQLPLVGLELTSTPLPQRRPRSSSSSPYGEGRRFSPSYRSDSTSRRQDSTPRQLWSRTPSPSLGERWTWRGEGCVGQGYDHGTISHIGGSCRYVHGFVDGATLADADGACASNRYGNSALEHGFYHEVTANRASPARVVVASPTVDCGDSSSHVWEKSTACPSMGWNSEDMSQYKQSFGTPTQVVGAYISGEYSDDDEVRGSDPFGDDEFIEQGQDAAHVESCPAPPSEVALACCTTDRQASQEAARCAGVSVTLKRRPDTVADLAGGCAAERLQPMPEFASVGDSVTSVGVCDTSDANTDSTGLACRQQCQRLIYDSFLFGHAIRKDSICDIGSALDVVSSMKSFLPNRRLVRY
eukprot:TRINITY_DN6922_c0_g3_i2.p1 TRINITY_DN6922_c0_g3~~TRINITY_DN6922_c0_g3_i2.p1  ORF type:complete len:515 (+),score=53.67 TRINITY_DN6922_c0_g3_i2:70-1545(+)